MRAWNAPSWGRMTAAALLCAAVVVGAAPASAAPSLACNPALAVAPFLHERPPACWRPYDDASPWNLELPSTAPLDPRSASLVRRAGTPAHVIAGWAGTQH